MVDQTLVCLASEIGVQRSVTGSRSQNVSGNNAIGDGIGPFTINGQQLEHRYTAAIAPATTCRATWGSPSKTRFFLATGSTQPWHQALVDHQPKRGRHQPRRAAKIPQAAGGIYGCVGVQGCQDQVAGAGSLQSQRGRFSIPDLSHQQDVRIMSEHGTQSGGKAHPAIMIDLDLADPGDPILNRILDGE
jgi:hypothetical protein